MNKNLSVAVRRALSVTLPVAALVAAAPAQAAFFQLVENSPAGMGNAFAGGAAIAEDASTVWYNPAGMTRLKGTDMVAGLYYIQPSIKASNVDARTSPAFGPIGNVSFSGNEGGDAGESAYLPNLYIAHPLGGGLSVGLAVNVPFGLATDYDDGWAGRYHANRSHIVTLNVNPAVAYRVNEQWSVGAGVSYQRIDAELSQAIDFATICTVSAGGAFSGTCGAGAGVLPGTNDGDAKITADDTAWGFNLGVLWQMDSATRFGFAYRSKIEYSLKGDADITAPANVPALLLNGAGLVSSAASANVDMPATLSVSAFHQLSPSWAMMADVTRTYWSDLPELRIEFDSAQPDSVVTLDLEDVNRYSVGLTYTAGGAWTFRGGVALDQSPTPNAAVRTPRLPDSDRTWVALGAGYRASKDLSFDVSFAYLKVHDTSVDKSATGENLLRGSISADYESETRILGAQLRWQFE